MHLKIFYCLSKFNLFIFIWLISFIPVSLLRANKDNPVRIQQVLDKGWYIKQLDTDEPDIALLTEAVYQPDESWMATSLPAQVQDVLMKNGKIPDPRLGKNAAKCVWVFQKNWAYATTFSTPKQSGPVFLRFEGLDTVVEIYLNGQKVGAAQNMFRRYKFDIGDFLNTEKNENVLLLIFYGPARVLEKIEQKYNIPDYISTSKYMRKSHSDFSDYLGAKPNYMKVGIFRDVILDVPGNLWLEDIFVYTKLSENFSKAAINVEWQPSGKTGNIRWQLMDPDGKKAAEGNSDSNLGKFTFQVLYPKLWWPHTHGKPNLYQLKLEVCIGERIQEIHKLNVGIRDIKMIQFDQTTGENRFAFEINGQRIFQMGAGWAPLEGMTHCWDQQRSSRQIDIAIKANMNTIRVWGEGHIPPKEFYDECDRKGILIWQDFYFGYHVSPVHEVDFLENSKADIEDTIKRLRNFPSIFIWVGGNENHMGYEFSNNYLPAPDRELYEKVMPEIVKTFDPTRPFHPSSPWGGPFANYPLEGDWHDYTTLKFVPLSSVPLYGSEIARVSAPSVSSMLKYMTSEELWPRKFEFKVNKPGEIAWPEMWQYRSAGSAWDKLGRIEQFCDPESPEDLVRALGIAHGEYWQDRIERERRGVPNGTPDGNRRCWGNLVWRLNDSWPITYMSAIDYYLEPKIAYYYLKRSYNPVLISFEKTADKIHVWVVNDSPQPISGTLSLIKMNFLGKILGKLSTFIHLNPGESRRCLDETPLGPVVLRRELLTASFNETIVTLLLEGERYLHLPESVLTAERTKEGVAISTDYFARQVTLEIPGVTGALFEDNFFDLISGQERIVRILDSRDGQKLRVKALNSAQIELSL